MRYASCGTVFVSETASMERWFHGSAASANPRGDSDMRWTSAPSISVRPSYLPLCLVVLALSSCHNSERVSLTVSAAASLQSTLGEVETAYFRGHPKVDFRNNFGSSGTLAREIEQGAPVDVFLSAAAKPMDDLESKGLIAAGTRENILHNSLVLIA